MLAVFLLICLGVAQLRMGYTVVVETKATKETTIDPSNELPSSGGMEISILQQQILDIEEKYTLLVQEIDLLRNLNQRKEIIRHRRRRDETENLAPLPNTLADCLPGTNGCPITVTPYSNGRSCILCPAGPRGYPGQAGPSGREGRDGRDSVAIVNAATDMCSRGTSINNPPPNNTSGSIYVRWGHKECPPSSVLVYTGIVGGSHYSASGNGANQLCLPEDPIYDNPVSGVGSSRSFLYSIEYQISNFRDMDSRLWHEVPCAVCKSSGRFAKLMIPGKNLCPSDEWTFEYGGYLMTERSHDHHKRSMFICVDREMQTVDGTSGASTDQVSGLLDLVESRCVTRGGGLPCGPYIDGYEMTCSVCTH